MNTIGGLETGATEGSGIEKEVKEFLRGFILRKWKQGKRSEWTHRDIGLSEIVPQNATDKEGTWVGIATSIHKPGTLQLRRDQEGNYRLRLFNPIGDEKQRKVIHGFIEYDDFTLEKLGQILDRMWRQAIENGLIEKEEDHVPEARKPGHQDHERMMGAPSKDSEDDPPSGFTQGTG